MLYSSDITKRIQSLIFAHSPISRVSSSSHSGELTEVNIYSQGPIAGRGQLGD